jgi:hypothetical protein
MELDIIQFARTTTVLDIQDFISGSSMSSVGGNNRIIPIVSRTWQS